MKRVLVLLSTYNGEKYLSEQLDSIITQESVDLTVLVRDDGSTDNTPQILDNYQNKFPDKIIVEFSSNIGCTASFLSLMKLAARKYRDYDYYAFADQDDVWLPDKLKAAAMSLDSIENNIKLYYCIPKLVNQDLIPLKSVNIQARHTLGETMILQPCIGCSMVFSKDLLTKASIIDPLKVDIHDAWTYRVCLALGGKIICDTTHHILYRQHLSNVIGGSQGFLKKWKRRFKRYFRNNRIRSSQARLILNTYRHDIPQKELSVLTTVSNYHDSLKKKMDIILDKNFSSNQPFHNLMFKTAILFGKI